ncbi:MAG: PAS domain S-box protein [Polyangiaceae bacterium]|nr:PAS domain S-box protein [Polyangiaceae bacterium]
MSASRDHVDSTAYCEALVESTMDALVALSTEGAIVSWNWGAMRMFGHRAEHAIDKSIAELLFLAEHRAIATSLVEEAAGTGYATYEGRAVDRSGSVLQIELVMKRVDATSDRPPWIAMSIRDATERTRLMQEIFEQNRKLEETLARLQETQASLSRAERLAVAGEVAASVCHDLRNPLGAARNALEFLGRRMLAAGVLEDAKVAKQHELMKAQLAACHRILHDVLDRVRERPLELAGVPLRELVEATIALVQVPAHVTLANEVPDDIVLECDANLVKRCIMNVVHNGIEAISTIRGGAVRIEGSKAPDHILLVIADDGAGIPDALLARVREPLFTTKTHGTGLGLAIASNVMARHEGDLDIQSEVDKGTTVRLRFPVRSAAA